MQIKLMRTRDWQDPGEEECSICGERFYLGEVTPVAASDAEIEIGEVCPACIEAGPEELQRRLDARAEFDRRQADESERFASEGVDYMPTTDELLLAEDLYTGGI